MASRTVSKLTFREVDADHWDDFVRLFAAKGCPKYCWCMAWRATTEEIKLKEQAERSPCMTAFAQDYLLGCSGMWGASLSRGAPLLLAQPFEAW